MNNEDQTRWNLFDETTDKWTSFRPKLKDTLNRIDNIVDDQQIFKDQRNNPTIRFLHDQILPNKAPVNVIESIHDNQHLISHDTDFMTDDHGVYMSYHYFLIAFYVIIALIVPCAFWKYLKSRVTKNKAVIVSTGGEITEELHQMIDVYEENVKEYEELKQNKDVMRPVQDGESFTIGFDLDEWKKQNDQKANDDANLAMLMTHFILYAAFILPAFGVGAHANWTAFDIHNGVVSNMKIPNNQQKKEESEGLMIQKEAPEPNVIMRIISNMIKAMDESDYIFFSIVMLLLITITALGIVWWNLSSANINTVILLETGHIDTERSISIAILCDEKKSSSGSGTDIFFTCEQYDNGPRNALEETDTFSLYASSSSGYLSDDSQIIEQKSSLFFERISQHHLLKYFGMN